MFTENKNETLFWINPDPYYKKIVLKYALIACYKNSPVLFLANEL